MASKDSAYPAQPAPAVVAPYGAQPAPYGGPPSYPHVHVQPATGTTVVHVTTQGQPGNPVITTQAQPYPEGPQQFHHYGRFSQQSQCQHCHQTGMTRVEFKTGVVNWIGCVVCAALGCGLLGCCFIPFCVESMKDVHHFCSHCEKPMGISKAMS